jgi:putative cardiolipin synthase
MGLVIDSPLLAQAMAEGFDTGVALAAHEVVPAADGRSRQWSERTAAGEKRYDTEPETSFLKRLGVGTMSILPIDWLL